MDYKSRQIRFERLEARALLAADLGVSAWTIDLQEADTVAAAVAIEEAEGVRAASIKIQYDRDIVQPDVKTIRAGSVWGGKGLALANVDDEAGTITAFVFSAQGLNAGSGTLLEVDFFLHDTELAPNAKLLDLTQLNLNEGEINFSRTELVVNEIAAAVHADKSRMDLAIAEAKEQPTKALFCVPADLDTQNRFNARKVNQEADDDHLVDFIGPLPAKPMKDSDPSRLIGPPKPPSKASVNNQLPPRRDISQAVPLVDSDTVRKSSTLRPKL